MLLYDMLPHMHTKDIFNFCRFLTAYNSRLLKKQCHDCTQIIDAVLWDVTQHVIF